VLDTVATAGSKKISARVAIIAASSAIEIFQVHASDARVAHGLLDRRQRLGDRAFLVQVGRVIHAATRGLTKLLGVAALALAVAGCGADLGECDDALAHTLVYDPAGTPFYAGQAMVQESCAGSFCHSGNATKDARLGAPFELDFDVPVIDAMDSAEAQAAQLELLSAGHATVTEWLEDMWGQVDGGSMPPGAPAGKRAKLSWSASDGLGGALGATEDTVPSVTSKAGKEVLRNWLACGAPVVAATTGTSVEAEPIGDVLPPADNVTAVEATWESIHAKVIVQNCTSCHNAAMSFPGTTLDLSAGPNGASDVLPRLVDQPASSAGLCAGMGTLIIASDCQSSIFFQKLRAADGVSTTCGDPMPLAALALTQPEQDAICTWIDAGALP
jgi:hypothetical protein